MARALCRTYFINWDDSVNKLSAFVMVMCIEQWKRRC